MSVDSLVEEAVRSGKRMVEVTGGEPLAQAETLTLLSRLCDEFDQVLLETGGGVSIRRVDARVRIILDVKCPGSGMSGRMVRENLSLMRGVSTGAQIRGFQSAGILSVAVQFVEENGLEDETLLVSPVLPGCSSRYVGGVGSPGAGSVSNAGAAAQNHLAGWRKTTGRRAVGNE